MMRMFKEHCVRHIESLWTLKLPDGTRYPAIVPGVWETIPDLAAYQGKAVYTRNVVLETDSDVLLRFGGVSHTAEVFWDGQSIRQHYNAFTGFEVLIKKG